MDDRISLNQDRLSLYLDGRLDDVETQALENELRKNAALAEELRRLRALQGLSEQLGFQPGAFTADEIRFRAAARSRRIRKIAISAAAVLLVVTHAAAFLIGSTRTETGAATEIAKETPAVPRIPHISDRAEPIHDAEQLLGEFAKLDPGSTPHDQLNTRLVSLQQRFDEESFADRLNDVAASADTGERQIRAMGLAGTFEELHRVFENGGDPGIVSLMVASIARKSLKGEMAVRFPANLDEYMTVLPLSQGTFRVVRIVRRDGKTFREEEILDLPALQTKYNVRVQANSTRGKR
ncbi:MAG: hypothetical protein V3T86_15760 [Planctomycetota bacterium]